MQRVPLRAAAIGAAAAITVATVINATLALMAGDTLVVPGELGVGQIVIFTAVMVVPTALVLWWRPRWLPAIVIGVALATTVFPFAEFGSPIGWWLSAMHLITGICAAVIAPRIADRIGPT